MKQPILRDRPYLDWLRTQPCLVTGWRATEYEAVDPCHIGQLGMGVKSPDDEAIPLKHSLHTDMHNRGEMTVLRERAPDWLLRDAFRALARQMYTGYKRVIR